MWDRELPDIPDLRTNDLLPNSPLNKATSLNIYADHQYSETRKVWSQSSIVVNRRVRNALKIQYSGADQVLFLGIGLCFRP